ncbi:MAG TPA: glycosyltransferase family 87 protein, partial [Urbifossiella sp.]
MKCSTPSLVANHRATSVNGFEPSSSSTNLSVQENRSANWAKFLPIVIWTALAVAVGVKALLSPEHHSVWPIFANASLHWWEGKPLYVYYSGLDMYRYSPTFALLISPLAFFPLPISGCLWGMGSVALLYAALRTLHRDVLEVRPGRSHRAIFLILSAVGVAPMAWNLQTNILILALISFGTASAARGQWWRAAFLLALPVFIKLWPVAWLAVVAAGRPRQLLPRSMAALAALAAIPFLMAAPDTALQVYRDWGSALNTGQAQRWPGYRDLITVFLEWDVAIDPAIYRIIQLAGAGLVLSAAFVSRHVSRSDRIGLSAGLAAWMCWQLLVGPGSE